MKIYKQKFGGMISGKCDPMSFKKLYPRTNDLHFSHGRSGMIWLVNNSDFSSCLMCAYTWPAIPRLMKKLKLRINFYDLFDRKIEKKIENMNGRVLLIVPVFYGFKPWIEITKITKKFGDKVFVLIDAAQTAYGHLDYKIPKNGAILSCPHKSLSTNDGAVLSFNQLNIKLIESYKKLQKENKFTTIKSKTRRLLNSNDLKLENEGLSSSKKLEETWKSFPPKKMSSVSYKLFYEIDPKKHNENRKKSYKYLSRKLKNRFNIIKDLKLGVPFGYPVLTKNRNKIARELNKERIFATSLWKNNSFINKKYPNALKYKKEFLAFPLDQRYKLNDLNEMVKKISIVLKNIKL